MDYMKVLAYADVVEIFNYERRPNIPRNKIKINENKPASGNFQESGANINDTKTVLKEKSPQSVRRSVLDFRRLVRANLTNDFRPILITLTFRQQTQDIRSTRPFINDFSRHLRRTFTDSKIRSIFVAERHRSGKIHYHALVWGLPSCINSATERHYRILADLWGQGFIDLKETDNNPRIATYLSKYFSKQFSDPQFFGLKSYIASSNIYRPQKDVILQPYISEFSTIKVLHDIEFDTQWLGKGRYRRIQVI